MGGARSRSATTLRSSLSRATMPPHLARPDGRVTARPPLAIAERTAEIARAKETLKELRKAIGIERGRVEDLFTEDREWPLAEWRTRYLEHPLTRTIARRLIWTLLDGDERTPRPRVRRRAARRRGHAGRAVRRSAGPDLAPDRRGRRRDRRLADAAHRPPAPPAVQAGVPRGLPAHARRGADRQLLEPVRGPCPALPAGASAHDGPSLGLELPRTRSTAGTAASRSASSGPTAMRAEFWHDASDRGRPA